MMAMLRRPAPALLLWLVLLTLYRLWVIPRLGITLYVDEAQYWTWAQAPDWGYYSKPPVIAWLIAASTALFGDGLLAVKLPALLLYPATAWLVFLLVRRLHDEDIALKAGVAFSLMPLVSALGLFVSTDAPLLFCWTAAMIALLRALDANRWRDWLLLGAAVGFGVMSKYTMAAFGASALLYLLLDPARRSQLANPRLWIAVLLATLIVLPNLWWNWQHDFPTLRHTAEITHVSENDKGGNAGEFIGAQVASLGPLFALAFAAALIAAWRTRREQRTQVMLSFALPLLAVTLLQSARAEANGNWAAPALVTALIMAVAWLCARRAAWWWSAVALNAALMFAVYHLQDFRDPLALPPKWDPLKRARGWDALAAEVRPMLLARPDALLVTDDRAFAAHMLYELRALKPELAMWNNDPHGVIRSHYQLTAPLTSQHAGRNAVVLFKWDPSAFAHSFQSGIPFQSIQVPVAEGRSIDAWLGYLDGFASRPDAQ